MTQYAPSMIVGGADAPGARRRLPDRQAVQVRAGRARRATATRCTSGTTPAPTAAGASTSFADAAAPAQPSASPTSPSWLADSPDSPLRAHTPAGARPRRLVRRQGRSTSRTTRTSTSAPCRRSFLPRDGPVRADRLREGLRRATRRDDIFDAARHRPRRRRRGRAARPVRRRTSCRSTATDELAAFFRADPAEPAPVAGDGTDPYQKARTRNRPKSRARDSSASEMSSVRRAKQRPVTRWRDSCRGLRGSRRCVLRLPRLRTGSQLRAFQIGGEAQVSHRLLPSGPGLVQRRPD